MNGEDNISTDVTGISVHLMTLSKRIGLRIPSATSDSYFPSEAYCVHTGKSWLWKQETFIAQALSPISWKAASFYRHPNAFMGHSKSRMDLDCLVMIRDSSFSVRHTALSHYWYWLFPMTSVVWLLFHFVDEKTMPEKYRNPQGLIGKKSSDTNIDSLGWNPVLLPLSYSAIRDDKVFL